MTNTPVLAWIDGWPADIIYACAAPGLIEGVFQLNVRVPAAVSTGPAVPVPIQVNSLASADGGTIAVQAVPVTSN